MIVTERYVLPNDVKQELRSQPEQFGYGLLGLATYYRTYSRVLPDGRQERWADTVIRVVEGVFSIRKWWYLSHNIEWDEYYWNKEAHLMANAIFHMRFLPRGRGLWAGGTEYVYERGGLALNNCQFIDIHKLSDDVSQIADSLMLGCGVGFATHNARVEGLKMPVGATETYVIPDSREGWVESIRRLIETYEMGSRTVVFDYSEIRPEGAPIKGFGGTASGPAPLEKLHERLRSYLENLITGTHDRTRAVSDMVNAVGACVVAGNVRRSAELNLGSIDDETFANLKNFDINPDRADVAWMSNNSVALHSHEDFTKIPSVVERIVANGEPGFVNMVNIRKYGRYGEHMYDTATGTNPCSEATLEDAELCCLVEVFPTHSKSDRELYEAIRLATMYVSTISLLPTHNAETNAVVERNHRVGVSMSGIADWFDQEGATRIIRMMRYGYRIVEFENRRLALEAGVPESIRKTVVKPSGTVSLVAGVSPGMHYPPFARYIRRVRVGQNTPIVPLLVDAGIPHEPDVFSDNTLVFEFPVETKAKRGQRDLTIWQKGAMVTLLQQHWADQMVSNTITFNPKTEAKQLEDFLGFFLPMNKATSLLPDNEDGGAYAQMPYEAIGKNEFESRKSAIRDIDWSAFEGSDGADSRYCESDSCEVDYSKIRM